MSDDPSRLLLLSSDSRRRYAEDILTALALPPGSHIQFRYDSRYVAASLQRSTSKSDSDGGIIGSTATLAFIGDPESPHPFVVPVRFATVVAAEDLGDMIVFKLRVGSYVNLDRYPFKSDEILDTSRKFVDHLIAANGAYYPAVSSFGALDIRESRDDASDWLKTAQRLAQYKTFAKSYFLRTEIPVTQAGNALAFSGDGRLPVVDRESVRLPVSFYSQTYDLDAKPVLTCSTDGTFLRVSSDDTYEVALRYDTVEFWLHPEALNFDTLSRVTIALKSESDVSDFVPAYNRIPVIVRRSTSRMLIRIATTAAGALLIALPAILGAGAPLQLRIASAILGAALLAISTIALGSPK
jgi:hypothetical protein